MLTIVNVNEVLPTTEERKPTQLVVSTFIFYASFFNPGEIQFYITIVHTIKASYCSSKGHTFNDFFVCGAVTFVEYCYLAGLRATTHFCYSDTAECSIRNKCPSCDKIKMGKNQKKNERKSNVSLQCGGPPSQERRLMYATGYSHKDIYPHYSMIACAWTVQSSSSRQIG